MEGNQIGSFQGLSGTPNIPFTQPKSATISEVENGFSITLSGGKQDPTKLYRQRALVATTDHEALKIVRDFLTEE